MKDFRQERFEKLFGIDREKLGEALIISPFFNIKFFKSRLNAPQAFRGMIYHGLTGKIKGRQVSFINTGMGQSLVADCVLAQDPRKIKTMIFLGAAGIVKDFEIADIFAVEKAFFDTEYFQKFGIDIDPDLKNCFSPSGRLLKNTMSAAHDFGLELKTATLVSLHTFLDQGPERARAFRSRGIQAVDLECALFYAAAKKQNIDAVALCFASDDIQTRPFWGDFSQTEKASIKQQVFGLCDFSLKLAVRPDR